MKILHVITTLHTGGAEKLMVDLLPRLRDLGNDVELVVLSGRHTSFYNQLDAENIKIHSLGERNVYHPFNLFRLKKYIGKYDIIHTHNAASQYFTAIGSVGTNQILCTTEHSTSNRRREHHFLSFIERWMYGRYKKIICISKDTEICLRKSIKSKSLSTCVINNGIDVNRFANAQPANKEMSEWAGKITIMQIASFRNQKDQDTLIRSITHLPEEYHAVFVGDGFRKKYCESLAKELNVNNRCHFLGIRSDIPQLIKAADIIVMSSHSEGFGLAAVEGMAAGKPVIATDVVGIREVVKDAGILFPPKEDTFLAKEIVKLIEDTEYKSRIVQQCKAKAREYDISIMAEKYNNVYKDLTKQA